MRHKKEISTCRYLFSYIGGVGENYVFSESFSGFSSVLFSLSWVLSFPVSWVSFSAFSPSCFADSSSCKISSERDTHGRFPKICSTSSEKITSREINTSASCVGFKAENTAALSGLTLKNVKLSYAENGKTVYSQFGEALFTHEGISGPAALTLSSLAARKDVNGSELVFDLKPALDADMLDKRVLRDFDEGKNKDLGNVLTALMPKALIPFVAEQAGLKEDKKVNSISAKERKKLVEVIKNLKFAVKGFCAHDSAIITAGGVDVKEINPNTMESKLVENLYFCGEMTDVDALTGGFNMQIAFSTGFLAGKLKGVKS